MRVADPGVVLVWSVHEAAVSGVALYEGGVRHPRVIEHEPPLQAQEVQRTRRIAPYEVRLELEPRGKGRDGRRRGVHLGSRRPVGTPAALEVADNRSLLRVTFCEVSKDGKAVSILRG